MTANSRQERCCATTASRSAPPAGLTWMSREGSCKWCRLPKLPPETGRWASGVRGIESNGPRTRSVRRPARGAPNSHRPHAREPGAPATACPAPPAIEATAIRAPRSPSLDLALHPVGWVARSAPRSARDRDSLAPAGLPRFLDLEVPPRADRSTVGRLRDRGSRAHHGAREFTLGRATHSRRAS